MLKGKARLLSPIRPNQSSCPSTVPITHEEGANGGVWRPGDVVISANIQCQRLLPGASDRAPLQTGIRSVFSAAQETSALHSVSDPVIRQWGNLAGGPGGWNIQLIPNIPGQATGY